MCFRTGNMHNTGYCVFFYAFYIFVLYLVESCQNMVVPQVGFSIAGSMKQDCTS